MDRSSNEIGEHVRIPITAVAERYGRSLRTITRWIADPALGFPKPIYIRRRRYVIGGPLLEWEKIQPDLVGSRREPETA
jgi:hypothetical protein